MTCSLLCRAYARVAPRRADAALLTSIVLASIPPPRNGPPFLDNPAAAAEKEEAALPPPSARGAKQGKICAGLDRALRSGVCRRG
jgi:hypothetical protein